MVGGRRARGARPARAFWVMAIGMLLLELAWIVALPAFRGLDEFAHAFRADSLVHGQLLSRDPSVNGQLVSVDAALARAARPECTEYTYTVHDDCRPARTGADGRVVQATSAASYDPAYYVVAGVAALPFTGVTALYAMRIATALLTAALVGWAGAVIARWDSTGWLLTGAVLVLTPVMAYSGAVVAPNAVAYGAGLLFWAAALGVVAEPGSPPLLPLVVSAVLLAHTHTTGLVWLAAAAVALLLLHPPRWWFSWVRSDARRRGSALGVVVLAGVTAFAWVRWAATNSVGPGDPSVSLPTAADLAGQQVVWFFQTIGAFPDRTTPAPLLTYALWTAPVVLLLVGGFRRASAGLRRATAWLVACWVVVPTVLTLVSFRALSYAWQGRYALPLVAGIVLLASYALSRSRPVPAPRLLGVVVLTAAAHAWSVVAVAGDQAGRGLGYDLVDHLPHATALVLVLSLAGGLLPGLLVPDRAGREVVEAGSASRDPHLAVAGGAAPSTLVVVPTLGRRPELLRRSLASIRAQGRPDLDLVVVAPPSPSTEAIASEAGARLVPDPGRGGISGALNAALATAADGTRFFAWLGDDDLLGPGSLDRTAAALEADPRATLAYGWCDYVDEQDRVLFRSRAGRWAARIIAFGPNLVPQPGSLMRLDAVREVGGLDEGVRLAMDLDLFLRLRRVGRFVCVPHTVASFRWHADSLTVAQGRASMAESDLVRRRHLRPAGRVAYHCARWPGRWALTLAKQRVHHNARTAPNVTRTGSPGLVRHAPSA
ncbi:MAG: hypothetical protein JWR20_959 [Marmoricola sp.]|nr:hypothetical protein [Marmoricola sp.]